MDAKTIARFWSKVDRKGPDECWLWTAGQFQRTGYGSFWDLRINRNTGAHRISFEIANGPTEKFVLHRCDVRPCVNPGHLFEGTAADNNADRSAKGRNTDKRGEHHHLNKLTERMVREIFASPLPGIELARAYGISASTVSAIRRGNRWPHLNLRGDNHAATG